MATPYEVVCQVNADANIPVTKYRSKKTGISVVISEVESPLVNGYFALATEAHDDDGLPHTLEHLVFMGSEDYPYKGVLDLLANRCLASGTNAWTDTDHTCYTMTNAGSQGFLNLLPVYLDHILYATLTESAYITEVHHINGEGEDAGVVYCEMQARENSGESLTHLEMCRAMYPGRCGYRSETGGIMKNLRESTSHQKVCSYHKSFYRPENLCIILTGQISVADVFKVLAPFEDKVISKGDRVPFTRPWQTPVPPLGGSVETVVRYAADDESHGIVNVAWRGPAARDQYTYNSVSLLLDYLTDSAISPLQREFVEVDDHYCSHVNGGLIENSECTVFFKFDNVVTEKLRDIYPRLMSVLSGLTKGTEKLNMGRMANLIHRRVLDALSSLEDSPHDKMASYLIGDFLFSNTKQDMEDRVQMVPCHERMKTEPEAFWLGLINKFFIDKHYVLILGEPSTAERESLAQAEADRVARQQANLGKNGLQEKAAIFEKATEENERGVPESMITCVDVPDVASIFFHPIIPSCNRSAGNNRLTENADFPLDKIPFRFELDDIHTNFVQINALLDSSNVPQELKYYLPLFCEVLFESPLEREGVIVPHEDVISQLEDDVQKTEISLGVKGSSFSCGNFPQVVHIKIQVGKEKYERGVTWLREILYQTKFPADRLRTVAKRLSSAISQYKRKGNSVMNALIRNIVFSEDCNHYVSSMLRQARFLEQLLIRLDSEPKQIEEHLEQLRALITSPDNLTVHLSVNVKELAKVVSNPERVWATVVPPGRDGRESSSIKMRPPFDYVVPISECKTPSVIAGLGSVESAYLIQGVSCVKSHLHEDLAPIMVYIQFLIQMEGPMWRQIRGLGLSYHYSMYVQPDTGMLYFLLARSTHIVNAYKEGKDIVKFSRRHFSRQISQHAKGLT
ncbi:uncharacterized protein C05D11.1-like isoform X7 [Dreissena polymorpha]|uniref:uncharacterized protein C05D11.1-like isoform X7 n=1 Tax=Dreissena polymorpha TaxID=45954 RepID=UPI0022646D3A|nr:uncharacterized protein C05D11.1-like isoform X7 [Dreissena polymorpha]